MFVPDVGRLAPSRQILMSLVHGSLLGSRNVLPQTPFFVDLIFVLRLPGEQYTISGILRRLIANLANSLWDILGTADLRGIEAAPLFQVVNHVDQFVILVSVELFDMRFEKFPFLPQGQVRRQYNRVSGSKMIHGDIPR